MTKQEWFTYAKANRERLESLILNYHPSNLTQRPLPAGRITAPGAEEACSIVRAEVNSNFVGNAIIQFNNALNANDFNKVYSLLNETWFGVPETTACWQIRGFKEAVTLMEDVPEDYINE